MNEQDTFDQVFAEIVAEDAIDRVIRDLNALGVFPRADQRWIVDEWVQGIGGVAAIPLGLRLGILKFDLARSR